jgi:hypothetical protein
MPNPLLHRFDAAFLRITASGQHLLLRRPYRRVRPGLLDRLPSALDGNGPSTREVLAVAA